MGNNKTGGRRRRRTKKTKRTKRVKRTKRKRRTRRRRRRGGALIPANIAAPAALFALLKKCNKKGRKSKRR